MISHEIIGDDMQAVIITMGQGDQIRAEAGAMMYMTDSIEMDAKMEGGFLGGLKRFWARASSSRTSRHQIVGCISRMCQKDAFLCAQGDHRSLHKHWRRVLGFHPPEDRRRLADRIHAAYRGDRDEVKRDLGGMLGGLGDLIGGDR